MIDIHAPKVHTGAIGALALAVCGFGYVAVTHSVKAPSTEYEASASDLATLPFGRHKYEVFFTAGAGDFADELVEAIRQNGDEVSSEGDLLPHSGIWVSPDTDEGHKLADALSKLIGEPVKVGDSGSGDFQIGVGRKAKK